MFFYLLVAYLMVVLVVFFIFPPFFLYFDQVYVLKKYVNTSIWLHFVCKCVSVKKLNGPSQARMSSMSCIRFFCCFCFKLNMFSLFYGHNFFPLSLDFSKGNCNHFSRLVFLFILWGGYLLHTFIIMGGMIL